MLPLQPYHEGSYPPGPKFPQFGDDAIGGYLNAHAALAEKRRNMVPYHIGRLAQDGSVPLNALPSQVPASPHNPEDQATQAFDHPPPPPPPAPELVFEDAKSDDELAELHRPHPPASTLGNTFMNGANSTLANRGRRSPWDHVRRGCGYCGSCKRPSPRTRSSGDRRESTLCCIG